MAARSTFVKSPIVASSFDTRRHSARARGDRNIFGHFGTPVGCGSCSFSGRFPGFPIIFLIAVGFGRRPAISYLQSILSKITIKTYKTLNKPIKHLIALDK